jgi:hypothetical protein
MQAMLQYWLRILTFYAVVFLLLAATAFAEDRPADRAIQEEVWAIPVTLPTIAYVGRPTGNGPFPLVIMNHGVSLNQRERGFFPLVEFRDAAMWFARRGYMGKGLRRRLLSKPSASEVGEDDGLCLTGGHFLEGLYQGPRRERLRQIGNASGFYGGDADSRVIIRGDVDNRQ